MTQLSYQPAFDPFHTVFRFLRLREAMLTEVTPMRDHFRILDFYLLYPYRIENLRLKPAHRRYRKLATEYASTKPYGDLPEDRTMFGRMRNIQQAAIDTLIAKGLLDVEAARRGLIKRTEVALPDVISNQVAVANEREASLVEFLALLGGDYDLLGDNGLKNRSGLMEHRYDAA